MVDANFVQWLDLVNKAMEAKFFFGIDDMPDFDYTGCYLDDLSVNDTITAYVSFYPEYSN